MPPANRDSRVFSALIKNGAIWKYRFGPRFGMYVTYRRENFTMYWTLCTSITRVQLLCVGVGYVSCSTCGSNMSKCYLHSIAFSKPMSISVSIFNLKTRISISVPMMLVWVPIYSAPHEVSFRLAPRNEGLSPSDPETPEPLTLRSGHYIAPQSLQCSWIVRHKK